jgi:hypothetical protein
MGVVPLVASEGAGAEMRRAMGVVRLFRHARCNLLRPLPDAALLRRRSDTREAHYRPRANRRSQPQVIPRTRTCGPVPRQAMVLFGLGVTTQDKEVACIVLTQPPPLLPKIARPTR